MAKRKRKGTAAPKAKRSRIVKEFQLDIFGGKKIVGRRRALTEAEQAASEEFHRAADEYFASGEFHHSTAQMKARRQRHLERIARRPVDMRRHTYTLPADVSAFLQQLYHDHGESASCSDESIEAAYMEGCHQGFIEGFLYGEDKARPGALKNRERLRQQNLEKLERLGIEQRNTEIVAEFHRLERELPGKEDRYQRLADEAKAEKPARENWPTSARQIADIIRMAPKRRR